MTNRLFSVGSLLDWMADGSLPGGVRFLSRAHGEDTHAKAMELLKKAVGSCKDETKDKPIGSPALWVILLAQQAHALQYGWGAGNPTLWDVHAMHELLRERQDQRVTLEGDSRAPRDACTVGRGLTKAQRQREGERVAAVKHVRAIDDARTRVEILDELGCEEALRAKVSSADWHPDGVRVDELGDDDAIKAKVGRMVRVRVGLSLGVGLGVGLRLGLGG